MERKGGIYVRSICQFLPENEYQSIQMVYFVYETEFHKLKQPFIHAIYYIFLIVKGTGELHMFDASYALEPGTVFIVFPGTKYTMKGSGDFVYMYISFMGDGARNLIAQTTLQADNPVIPHFNHLIGFWRSSIQRIQRENANILSECVLLYTLSFFTINHETVPEDKKSLIGNNVLKYIDNHYMDQDLSLKKIAGIFAYSEKYLSRLFKQSEAINFSEYLNKQRIAYAIQCVENSMDNITDIAHLCGYSDPLYFSKVFKKYTGLSPKDYIKKYESAESQ